MGRQIGNAGTGLKQQSRFADAGGAAAILGGALRAASLNVLVNTKAMGAAGAPLTERCRARLARGEAASDAVFKQVKDRLL